MSDPFVFHNPALNSPATRHYTIEPSDTVDLPIRPRAVYVATDGNAVLQDNGGVNVTYPVTAGQLLMIRPTRILATGTTATLVGWY